MTRPTVLDPIRGYRREVPQWERRDMTVCIAAICEDTTENPRIVLCMDRKASSELGSAETMIKSKPLSKGWRCLTAGTDSDILALVQIMRAKFEQHKDEINETNVLHLVRGALNQRKTELIEEMIYGKFAISYSEFFTAGKTNMPDDQFNAIMMEVEHLRNDAELIVVGFPCGFPMLITTKGTRASIKEDFAVIGEGAYLAQASLLTRAHAPSNGFDRVLYVVYEAKRFAEGAPSVGKRTLITVHQKDGTHRFVSKDGHKKLDEYYQKYGPQAIPKRLEMLDNFLN